MSRYHGDQRLATAASGEALEGLWWELVGYKPDRSDSMTDYYDPARWDGIARNGGALALVDVSAYDAERVRKPQTHTERVDVGPCPRCGDAGADPDLTAWTLAAARVNPIDWHVALLLAEHPGSTPVEGRAAVQLPDGATVEAGLAHVVSPIPWRDEKAPRCVRCHGHGRRYEVKHVTEPAPPWAPLVVACPGRWRVVRESDGRVLGTGVRPLAAGARGDDRGVAARCAADIDQALTHRADGRPRVEAPAPGVEVGGTTVRPSTMRAGFVEVVHGSKPPEDVRAELKAAGFRWAFGARCWYGPAARLPARYASDAPAAPAVSP